MGAMARRLEAPQEIKSFEAAPADREEHDIDAWAAHELSHALAHDWLELEGLAPFADCIDCDPEAGQPFDVVRSYRWADAEGGDMVCEVTVYATADRRGHFVRRRCTIARG